MTIQIAKMRIYDMVFYEYDRILNELVWNDNTIEYASNSGSKLMCIQFTTSGINSSKGSTSHRVTTSKSAAREVPPASGESLAKAVAGQKAVGR